MRLFCSFSLPFKKENSMLIFFNQDLSQQTLALIDFFIITLFGSCIFQAGEPPSRADPAMKVVIDQSDMFTHVFSALEDNKVIVHSSELYILAQLKVINFSHGK